MSHNLADSMALALLNRAHPQEIPSFLKYWPQEDEARLALEAPPKALPQSMYQIETLIKSMHYSWLDVYLENYPVHLRQLMTSSQVSPFVHAFFLRILYRDHLKDVVVPQEFLPDTPLKGLLSLTKAQLVQLIDLLGIQDLAGDLRKILDKKVFDLIHSKLSTQQAQYLDSCLKKQDLPLLKSEAITFWSQDMNRLSFLIHSKGLQRLASALADEDSGLIWHITHLLDIGRGKELQKLIRPVAEKVKEQMAQQVLGLLKIFKGQ